LVRLRLEDPGPSARDLGAPAQCSPRITAITNVQVHLPSSPWPKPPDPHRTQPAQDFACDELNMTSLRKACTNCTASKRKCDVQKPKCVRCSHRDLECVYELEPLKAQPTALERVLTFGFTPSACNSLGICIIRTIQVQGPDVDPAVCSPGYGNALEVTRLGYDTVLELIRAEKPASFVHPKLQLPSDCNHFTSLVGQGPKGVSSDGFRCLILTDIDKASPREVLAALQVLLIHLAASVFSSIATEQENAYRSLAILSEWTKKLLSLVDAGIPRSQSLWQDWLLGESKLYYSCDRVSWAFGPIELC
jgi:hypothetical protein